MRRLVAVVSPLLWGSLLMLLPRGPVTAQTPSPTHSSHAPGRGMHWTRVGGLPPGTTYLVVDTINMTGGSTDASLCANACSTVGYQQSTVPYYSLDVARNVTLHYSSTSVASRPVLFTDVHISPSSTKTLVEYDLQAVFNDGAVTFLNGDNVLRFSAPSPQTTEVRLAGQFDNRIYPTELDDVTVTVTAKYSDMSTDQLTYATTYVSLNTSSSYLGRGWTLAGHQKLSPQGGGYSVITNGDGSADWFAPNGTGTYLTETDGDFSVLTSTGSGSGLVYTRTYPDSSRLQFNYIGQETRAISSTSDTVSYGYNGGQVTQIYDPYRTYSGSNRSYITLHYNASGWSSPG